MENEINKRAVLLEQLESEAIVQFRAYIGVSNSVSMSVTQVYFFEYSQLVNRREEMMRVLHMADPFPYGIAVLC